ncbi:MAG: serine/threonine-protein kinase [Deltaproteobacteria bacterium]
MNVPTPRCFGKYEILQPLGSGSMGVVYLAYDPVIARRVAVKTIRKQALDAVVDATERFRREASAAGRLTHPGIVAVYDYGEENDVAYIVMEYAPGLELDLYVAQHRPSVQQIGSLMAELLDALGYAHASGVVHRDVKPGNILVADRLKITDFGIARIDNATRTETGAAVGTPAYMAPEQFMGKGVDHRVDLFAAGVILYELLTDTRPFDGQSLEELSYKICHTEPVAASTLNPKLPHGIDAVLAQALAKPKSARFASAAEFGQALSEALSGSNTELEGSGLRRSTGSAAVGTSAWAPDVLQRLEAILAPLIGSVAKVAVRRSAARAKSPTELLRLLTESIESEPTRVALSEQLRVALGEPRTAPIPLYASTARGDPGHVTKVTPEAIARVTLALANSVGPIARVMTKKAAADSSSYLDLCLRLSEQLSTEQEKTRFLKELGVDSVR